MSTNRRSISRVIAIIRGYENAALDCMDDLCSMLEDRRDAMRDRLSWEVKHIKEEESKRFPLTDWQYEVANGATQRGYYEWVAAKEEEAP